jgi:hypothetical protein
MTLIRTLTMLALLAPAAAVAAPAPAPVQRLTDAQVEQVLADAAARREAAEATVPAPAPAIYGEVGVEIGTGGHRAAYGTAFVPLGKDSGATISFLTQTGPQYYGHRRR